MKTVYVVDIRYGDRGTAPHIQRFELLKETKKSYIIKTGYGSQNSVSREDELRRVFETKEAAWNWYREILGRRIMRVEEQLENLKAANDLPVEKIMVYDNLYDKPLFGPIKL